MKIYIKKAIYVGVAVILVTGVWTGTASAFSLQDIATRIGELTMWINRIVEQLRGVSNKEEPSAVLNKEKTFFHDLGFGMKENSDVTILQQFLIARGYLNGRPTGNYFSLTSSAVKRLQKALDLPVTGVFDLQTREATNTLIVEQGGMDNIIKRSTVNNSEPTPAKATTAVVEQPIIKSTTTELYHIDARPTYDIRVIERETFDAVNDERQKNGLNALQWNEQLAEIARAHSVDQATDNMKTIDPDVACLYPYIRHEGFTAGFKVGDRLERSGVSYRMAGENIIILPITKDLIYRATATTATCKLFSDMEGPIGETQEMARARIQKSLLDRLTLMLDQPKLEWVNMKWKTAHEVASESAADWMNSPGHRHNILTPDFEEGAIGASFVKDYIIMTQIFLEK